MSFKKTTYILFLALILTMGCTNIATPYLELELDLDSFGSKKMKVEVSFTEIKDGLAILSFDLDETFSFHGGFKVSVNASESFEGNIIINEEGRQIFSASKEITYLIQTVDSANIITNFKKTISVTINGDVDKGEYTLTTI